MADIQDLDKISDNNQQTWPEGTMEGNQINNAGRDDESLMARWYADWNGTLVTAGTGSAYTVSANTNRVSYGNDLVLALRIHANSLDNPTLNVSGLGAVPWLKNGGDQINADDLRTDMLVVASYRDGSFYTMSSTYLGSAASKDTGVDIGDVVELEDVGGSAGLPAVVGSQLTDVVANGIQVFTASGSFSKSVLPSGVTHITVEIRGGGGGGGGADTTGASQSSAGAGGGQGERAIKRIAVSALAASETVTIGAGGPGVLGTTGGNGTATSFGTFVNAGGGFGGQAFQATTTGSAIPGGGGTGGTGGDIQIAGQAGSPSVSIGTNPLGGTGGGEGGQRSAAINADGLAGANGGGGSGATNIQNQPQRTGGAGGDGYCIVRW